MSFKTGDKVRLVVGTLFVGKATEGVVIEPEKGQTPPQLFPNRVCFPIGQDARTVWCGTDELELVVDAGGPETDNQVADGSRDYCPEGGSEDGNTVNTAPAGASGWDGREYGTKVSSTLNTTPTGSCPVCPCIAGGPCEALISEDEPWADDWTYEGELPSDFECDVSRVFMDAEALLLQKHEDYGPKNISQSPGGALNGLRVRMHDKLARLNNLVDKGQEPQVLNESLKDTLTDLANYAVIGIMVLEGTWPNE